MKKNILWFILFIYLILSFVFLSPKNLTFSNIQILFWIGLILFTSYTFYCTRKENFIKTLKKISALYWGKQIGIDLYIGLIIQFYIIYMNENSLLASLIWFPMLLIYGNIITLYYWALNADLILGHFLK